MYKIVLYTSFLLDKLVYKKSKIFCEQIQNCIVAVSLTLIIVEKLGIKIGHDELKWLKIKLITIY